MQKKAIAAAGTVASENFGPASAADKDKRERTK